MNWFPISMPNFPKLEKLYLNLPIDDSRSAASTSIFERRGFTFDKIKEIITEQFESSFTNITALEISFDAYNLVQDLVKNLHKLPKLENISFLNYTNSDQLYLPTTETISLLSNHPVLKSAKYYFDHSNYSFRFVDEKTYNSLFYGMPFHSSMPKPYVYFRTNIFFDGGSDTIPDNFSEYMQKLAFLVNKWAEKHPNLPLLLIWENNSKPTLADMHDLFIKHIFNGTPYIYDTAMVEYGKHAFKFRTTFLE
jgi:hypothetical protein